ncbi:hypothetical protein [Leptolyngbya sp. CCY15150]|uniref:hypothetical protein n=1 Tax=Leptolyngbya sp. CCY15150 TaxID=2767772 RepID=UPI00194DE606|nr:hypothetical protein [Leptolyngbya sp. CCY15150]
MHPQEFTEKWGIDRPEFRKMFLDRSSSTISRWFSEDCPQEIQEDLDSMDAIFGALHSIATGTPDLFTAYLDLVHSRKLPEIGKRN